MTGDANQSPLIRESESAGFFGFNMTDPNERVSEIKFRFQRLNAMLIRSRSLMREAEALQAKVLAEADQLNAEIDDLIRRAEAR